MNRRGFMGAILAASVAPFVVKAGSLMAVRVPESAIILDIRAEYLRQCNERMILVHEMIIYGALERADLTERRFAELNAKIQPMQLKAQSDRRIAMLNAKILLPEYFRI